MQNIKIERSALPGASTLEDRLIDFGVRIVALSANLPRTSAGKHLAAQILRCGTSPAPIYREGRDAESHAEFVEGLRRVLRELNETEIWLRIIDRSQLLRRDLVREITGETAQLCNLLRASLKNAGRPPNTEMSLRNPK